MAASTVHSFFDFNTSYQSNLDLGQTTNAKVDCLLNLEVLLLDEVSMLDTDFWHAMTILLDMVKNAKHGQFLPNSDAYGPIHIILFGDFKQLPPATSKAPFIATPGLHAAFDFRVLRQNRRVVSDDSRRDELETFHGVLFDIAHGICSDRVRAFIVAAYKRGAENACTAEDAEFEGSTAVFTKRRYRDKWNRCIVKRIAQNSAHDLKIKARVRAPGQRGTGWYGEKRVQFLRRKSRPQALWMLHLAGDFHEAFETEPLVNPDKRHMMRVMLTSNLAIDQRFANGTQGRIMYWHPKKTDNQRMALPASHPEIMARFVKESALQKTELFPDVHHIDVQVRAETLCAKSKSESVMLQLSLVPCYALTIHKTQVITFETLFLS